MRSEYPDQAQRSAVCSRQWAPNRNWYNRRDQQDSTELLITDSIGAFGVDPGDFLRELKSIPKDQAITVGINSPGGDVFGGFAIYNALRERGNVTTRVDGLAASIAAIILFGGKRVQARKNSMVMVHEPTGMVGGTAGDMRKAADTLDKIQDNLVQIVADRSTMTRSRAEKWIKDETWFTAQEALEANLIDEVDSSVAATNQFDLSNFRHPPSWYAEASVPATQRNGQTDSSDTMKKLLEAMAKAGIPVSVGADEDTALAAFNQWLDASTQALADLKAENANLANDLKARKQAHAEGIVDQAIKENRLPKDARKGWVELLVNSNGDQAVSALQAIKPPETPIGAVPPAGAHQNSDKTSIGPFTDEYSKIDDPAKRQEYRNRNWEKMNAELLAGKSE